MSLVLVKPRNEHKKIIKAYSWLAEKCSLRDDYSWLVGGNSKYYKSLQITGIDL